MANRCTTGRGRGQSVRRRSTTRNQVLVCCEDQEPEYQPETFRFCPLGVQFLTRHRLPEYKQIELNLVGGPGAQLPHPARCEGVVVHSEYDRHRRRFRNWILFINLSDDIRGHFRCLAEKSGWLCPHCENF